MEKEINDKPIIATSTEDRQLRVPLTEKELLEAGQKLADALQTLVTLDNELQSFKEQIKGKVAEAEGKSSRFGSLVRQKYEYRPVTCEIARDYTAKMLTVVRTDTGEIVEERPMTRDELQTLPMM